MTGLLIATTNPGKLREIRRILGDRPVRLFSLRDFPAVPEPDETGTTFAENARLKAVYYDQTVAAGAAGAAQPPLYTVAEDSGLVIDAMNGEPGVHSARFLRPDATYPERFDAIYQRLAGRPRPWTARFVAAIAVVRASHLVHETSGAVEGEIAPAPRGERGFGYDPIFLHRPLGLTLAEATDADKARVGHRGDAFRKLAVWLEAQNGEQRACPPFR